MFFNIDNQISNPGQLNGNNLLDANLSPFHYVLTYTSDCASSNCQSESDEADNTGQQILQYNEWNQYHNSKISSQASQFILKKILNTDPATNCKGICNTENVAINAAQATICTVGTIEITGIQLSGLNILWEPKFGYLQVVGGQGTNIVTLKRLGNGEEIIKVTLANSCGNKAVFTKKVIAGTPAPTLSTSAVCPLLIAQVTNAFDGFNFTWYITKLDWVNSMSEQETIYDSRSIRISVASQGFTTVNLCVKYSNGCGTSGQSCGGIDCSNTSAAHSELQLNPNPASSVVIIKFNNSEIDTDKTKDSEQNKSITKNTPSSKNRTQIYRVTIYNSYAVKVTDNKYGTAVQQVSVNTSHLPSGVYLVTINEGMATKPITKKLIISQ